jgi:hypothetical protein
MLIKYMGTSTYRVLEKGEDFGGRLSKDAALQGELRWTPENNHLIDTDNLDFELSEDLIDLILEEETGMFDSGQRNEDGTPTEDNTIQTMREFKDVTGLKRIPSSLHQQIYLGHKASTKADKVDEESADQTEGVKEGRGKARTSVGSRAGGDSPTTVGGSTGTGTSGGGTTVGGSTG